MLLSGLVPVIAIEASVFPLDVVVTPLGYCDAAGHRRCRADARLEQARQLGHGGALSCSSFTIAASLISNPGSQTLNTQEALDSRYRTCILFLERVSLFPAQWQYYA